MAVTGLQLLCFLRKKLWLPVQLGLWKTNAGTTQLNSIHTSRNSQGAGGKDQLTCISGCFLFVCFFTALAERVLCWIYSESTIIKLNQQQQKGIGVICWKGSTKSPPDWLLFLEESSRVTSPTLSCQSASWAHVGGRQADPYTWFLRLIGGFRVLFSHQFLRGPHVVSLHLQIQALLLNQALHDSAPSPGCRSGPCGSFRPPVI